METKEIKITPPEGFEIDKENSTFDCIKFKPIKKVRWVDNESALVEGYFIDFNSKIVNLTIRHGNIPENYNIFATKEQAKSALTMARISQIMANDERFGGAITNKEWKNGNIEKFCIGRYENKITRCEYYCAYYFLAFHTKEQRDLFLKENEDLVKDYLMID